jgi:hypothetical protein
MLPEVLQKRWQGCVIEPTRALAIREDGIALGKTLLAPWKNERLAIDEERIIALLSVTFCKHIPRSVIGSFHCAEKAWRGGDKALANMHLSLSGVETVDTEKAQRLFAAEWALDNHVSIPQLFKFAGLDKFNPYHLGPGPSGGQFTSASRDGQSNGLPPGAGILMRSELTPASSLPQGTQVTQEIIGPLLTDIATETGVSETAATASTAEAATSATADTATAKPEATEPPPTLTDTDETLEYDWRLGDFKPDQKWQNQMQEREWTLEDIDNVIRNGTQEPAPNDVHTGNPAVRYTDPTTGKYVVKDEATGEVLQISRIGFIPKKF